MAYSSSKHEQRKQPELANQEKRKEPQIGSTGLCSYEFRQWPPEPSMGRVVDGLAYRSHMLKAIGNGQVPRVAAAAFKILINNSGQAQNPGQ
jgi:DNA (cytosine-5)-methyltransferase 1